MGLLSIFSKATPELQELPSGSLTLDRNGHILASTVPSTTSPALLEEIGSKILLLFREAQTARIPLGQLVLNFASLQITARELRGGAILFLKPRNAFNVLPNRKL